MENDRGRGWDEFPSKNHLDGLLRETEAKLEKAEAELDQFKYDIISILNSAESYSGIGRRLETWWKAQTKGEGGK